VDGTGSAIFVEPRYVTITQEGNYVITDVATNTVKCISPESSLVFAYHPSGAHVLRRPQGLCIDNIGNIFIADYANSRIQLVTNEGAFQR
jgi:DNA-binding beta-propeller fold protein YncE